MTLEVALDAMKQDAATWDEVSGTLSTARYTVDMLAFSSSTWPRVIDVPLYETYEELRSLISTLLDQGSTQASGIATSLLEVKRDFETTDDAQAAAYRGKWEPLS